MYVIRTIANWGWSPALITVLAVAGYQYQWPIEVLITVLVVVLVIGSVVAVIGAREKELQRAALKLKQLASYFTRRFTGNSSLSIFAIINSLFNVENPKLWEWARACDMSQRVFDTWCDSFTARLESDIRARNFGVYLRVYLNELWMMSNHYHEFVEQFYEVAEKVEVPQEARAQYGKFVREYNAFVQSFRENITELMKFARTEIEPPSVHLAKELSA